jgi:ribosomal protein S18 acetylase RimI-like enzyme
MEDLTIEKCVEGDAEGIREVAKANNYFNPEYEEHNESGFTGTVYSKKVVEKIISQGYSFKIVLNRQIVGYFLGVDEEGFEDVFGDSVSELSRSFFGKESKIPGKIIYAPQAAIHPDFKGRGFARELFSEVRRNLKNKGFENIYAEILSNNKSSISFWKLMGFGEVAKRKPESVIVFKGYDKDWIEKNYSKLMSNHDKRVDAEFLSRLSWGLYKFSLEGF